MITVQIQGLQDGRIPIDITVPATVISALAPEFINEIHVHGTLTRSGRRFTVHCHVDATARLVCDRSLEEYDEPVSVDLELGYELDTTKANERVSDEPWDGDGLIPLREDAKSIDITDEVRQELVVHLPMRRVAPKYRDKEIGELFPDIADRTTDVDAATTDDTWAALKSLK